MWIGLGNGLIGSMLAWIVLAKKTRRMTHVLNARTMPEFFEARYKSTPMKITAALLIFFFLVPYAATVYKGLGTMFAAIFPGIDGVVLGMSSSVLCMLIVAVLTSIYLVLGGYVATAVTDFVQGIIMIGGVIVMVIALTLQPQVGGLSSAISKLHEIKPSLVSVFGGDSWNFLMINILLTSFGTWGLPQMVNKFYAIKDEASIRRGTVVSTVFALIISVGAYYGGSLGRLILGNQLPKAGYDSVVPTMLINAFGGNLGGNILLSLILLLLLSASMSTLAAIVLTSASAISVDLLLVVRPKPDSKKQMFIMRTLCFLFVALSFVFATTNFAIIVSIMSYSWGIVAGSFIGPFVWGLFSKKVTKAGAWSGMIGGITTVVVMTLVGIFTSPALKDGFYAAFKAASANSPTFGVTAMAVSLVLVPVVSMFTRKFDDEHITKVFSSVPDEAANTAAAAR
jgi:SSS family solute:Na+ symporter/sodium/proline symporter